jgi:hypothetical protein
MNENVTIWPDSGDYPPVTLVINTTYTAKNSTMPTRIDIDGKIYEVAELVAAMDWMLDQYRKAQGGEGE